MMNTMNEKNEMLNCIRELLARFPEPSCPEQEAAVEAAKSILLKND